MVDGEVRVGSRDGEGTCVFCSIREGRDTVNHVLVRDDDVLVVLNLSMITPGHTLVLPSRHLETLDQLTEDEVGSIWRMVRRVRLAIDAALAPAGFVYVHNEGVGYATEPHLHFHVVPRYPDDALRDMWETPPGCDHDELERVEALLSPHLRT